MFRVFIDSNVIIETLINVSPACRGILFLSSIWLFEIWTSQTCIADIQRFLEEQGQTTEALEIILIESRIQVQPDAPEEITNQVFHTFMPVMRDREDIPVLASALTMNPRPTVIISNNDEHFNPQGKNRYRRCS